MTAVRPSDYYYYIIFNQHDLLPKINYSPVTNVVDGIYISTKSLSGYYPDLNGRYPDAAFDYQFDSFFFFGKIKLYLLIKTLIFNNLNVIL